MNQPTIDYVQLRILSKTPTQILNEAADALEKSECDELCMALVHASGEKIISISVNIKKKE